tara:strand:+ start:1009 stop:4026 length:3018 start_codon:yes stop_codon:yes gene_type:complete
MFRRISKLFEPTRTTLLQQRLKPILSTRDDTLGIRNSEWQASDTPKDLQRRWVEITGPGNDAKMVINALNSSADGYMLDLEDSMTPTRDNIIQAHQNIREAVNGTLRVDKYKIHDVTKPIMHVRPRGLHLPHFDGGSAMLYDICEFLEGSAHKMLDNGKQPCLYIPKLESYEEAQFVNSVIAECEATLGLKENLVKVTVLIETFPAIFQTDEIIYALKDRIVGLNCGRWDYLFSMMKSLPKHKFPDRNTLSMSLPFMEAYVQQIVHTCHKRNIHAMGGMSAFIPSRDNNEKILERVEKDKLLEIKRGCDGAWVAHPGLIEPVQNLFRQRLDENHQKAEHVDEPITQDLFPSNESGPFSKEAHADNMDVSAKYISAWLNGNGAVALNGMMEDLATAEIALAQIRNWSNHNLVPEISIDAEPIVKHVIEEYVSGEEPFLHNVASKALDGFERVQFEHSICEAPIDGLELTKQRGAFLKEYLKKNDSYGFLGTSNGVSAVNVVAGGQGRVGPYAGGWQINAMKNRLGMCLPDTLHVSPEEAANCAEEINEHLYKAHLIQDDTIDYKSMALLADLEQGWNTPEKTRIAVRKAVQNGINVIHIEDQGEKKRCGHLGDKELNTYEDYAVIMRSANLAALEMGVEDSVTFVSRTDAYSAKRIHYSLNLADESHPEHNFVDWTRGASPDGKYLYLKTGQNPVTGNTYGLDLSIQRGAQIVSDGLATHVWMETPDADLQVAKDFLDGVNTKLAPEGKRAYGLYNHSPSFDWDVKFVAEAHPLAKEIADDIKCRIISYGNSMMDDDIIRNPLLTEQYEQTLVDFVHKSLQKYGSEVNGDYVFSEKAVKNMIPHLLDHMMGEQKWKAQFKFEITSPPTNSFKTRRRELTEEMLTEGFKPIEHITDIIVDERLKKFGPQLASFGYNMHLITLPEFHVTAYRMHDLAQRFVDTGIEAFVTTTQRPERIKYEQDPTYTYYKHQTATGTGIESDFNKAVGSANVNTLADSTEADDIKKRK